MLRFLFPGLMLAAIIVAGCGGGGGNGAVVPSTPAPAPSATISPGPTPQAVTLTGAGYTLQFTLPASFAGGGNLTATLQASPPSGVPVPSLKRRGSTNATKAVKSPDTVGSTPTTMVYLVVQASGTVQFTSIPSFVFTLPHGVSIPSGSPSYVAFYDPTQQSQNNGWIGVLGPGVISGQTDTFAGVSSGVTLVGGQSYVYALVYTTQAVPTATPAPTPTPVASPSSSPLTTPTPAPTSAGVAGTFPLTIVNSDTSAIASQNITLYIYGQNPTSNIFEGVKADGSTYQLLTAGSTVTPIPWQGGGGNQETVYLPPLIGGRVYVVSGTSLSSIFTVGPTPTPGPGATPGPSGFVGPNAPAPWSNDGSQNVYFDDIEYAETSATNVNFDLSQVDVLGLAMKVSATNASGTQTIGLMPGALTALKSALGSLPSPSPWNTLANDMPYHILNPSHLSSPTFLDSAIASAWGTYANGNWMEITAASLSATTYPGPLYGTEDGNGNLKFYAVQSTAAAIVGTIENPATYAAANNTTVTEEVLAQNGTFNNFTTPNTSYPTLGPAIGNRVSGALNSGVFVPSPIPGTQPISVQPVCTGRFTSGGLAYQNQYANALHTVANSYAYVAGAAYGYPYDDLCGTSTDTTSDGIQSMTLTINPS